MGSKKEKKYKKRSRNVINNQFGSFNKPCKGRKPKKAKLSPESVSLQQNDNDNANEQSHRPTLPNSSTPKTSASKSKLSGSSFVQPQTETLKEDDNNATGYRLIDLDILSQIVVQYMRCPECHSELHLFEQVSKRWGFASILQLKCDNCPFTDCFSTSSELKVAGKGRNPFEVNRRTAMAFREIGNGHGDMTRFCAVMNMPPPTDEKSLKSHIEVLQDTYVAEAESSMSKAAEDVCKRTSSDECGVSVDGTWQRRGYSSLNGVVTAIEVDSGKVLDYECLSRNCHGCRFWSQKDQKSAEYLKWKAEHKCKLNHTGSAAMMEPVGARRIWGRSVANRKLKYTSYIGDGDTKSFSAVCSDKPYGPTPIVKKECVGHIQKRVGGRCRKLKQNLGSRKLSDGKGISGKGRLTKQRMDTLQNYFGIGIRSNKGNREAMKSAIWASLYHVASTEESPDHSRCPSGGDSWCGYQRDVTNQTQLYKHTNGLPVAVVKELEPIYEDLTKNELLDRCLDCYTQNNNESFNGMIWQRIPKDRYVDASTMDIGVASATIAFNDGMIGLANVMKRQEMNPGFYTMKGLKKIDDVRILKAERKVKDTVMQRRKTLRRIKKGFEDKHKDQEGDIYDPGMGD